MRALQLQVPPLDRLVPRLHPSALLTRDQAMTPQRAVQVASAVAGTAVLAFQSGRATNRGFYIVLHMQRARAPGSVVLLVQVPFSVPGAASSWCKKDVDHKIRAFGTYQPAWAALSKATGSRVDAIGVYAAFRDFKPTGSESLRDVQEEAGMSAGPNATPTLVLGREDLLRAFTPTQADRAWFVMEQAAAAGQPKVERSRMTRRAR